MKKADVDEGSRQAKVFEAVGEFPVEGGEV